MLGWLPHLTAVFPEAVDLAIRMPKIPLQSSYFIYKLNESNLWQRYPEVVAKLSIYLGKCDLPSHTGYLVRKLIDTILKLDISPELKQELKDRLKFNYSYVQIAKSPPDLNSSQR